MKSTCWDTRAMDSIIRSGQKDTEASILEVFLHLVENTVESRIKLYKKLRHPIPEKKK